MSFVTTQPEALTAAAASLQKVGSSMTAQNAAAATPTTGVAPAAADQVSALQATQFAAYGNLYQQVGAQATAIHEMIVNTLGGNAGAYDTTEAGNAAANGASGSGLSQLFSALTGTGSASPDSGLLASTASNSGVAGAMQGAAFGSAASEFTGLGKAGFITGPPGGAAAMAGAAGPAEVPAATAGAAGPSAPVLAGLGQANSVGGASVPPSWAGQTAAASGPAPSAGATGVTGGAGGGAPATRMPAGLPSMAQAGRGGGLGTPRYGVKPKVMPRPKVV